MNSSRSFFAAVLVGTLFVPGILFAQTTLPAQPQPILVATVNIYNALITAQAGNTINISFDIGNRLGIQPGVRYSAVLTQTGARGQVVVDEQVFDETLTLGQGSMVHKDITYTAPAQLSGTYDLWLSSKNNGGLALAVSMVGKVRFQPPAGGAVLIDPASCFLTIEGEAKQPHYTLAQGVDIASTETLNAHCVVQNTTDALVTLAPSFVTYVRNAYGAVVSATGGGTAALTLAANAKKTVIVALPKAATPQAYDVLLTFSEVGSALTSNAVRFHYVLQGASATIQNVSWDKNAYQKGETAVVSVIWASSADSFAGSRNGSGTPLDSPAIELSVTDQSGASCGTPVTQPLSGEFVFPMQFAITKECVNPVLSTTIKDTTHGVLAQRNFATAETPTAVTQSSKGTLLALLILILLCGIGGAALYFTRKKGGNISPTVPGAMIALLVVLGGVFAGAPAAHADTFYSPGNAGYVGNPSDDGATTYVINFNKSEYLPGEQIRIDSSVSAAYCDNVTYDHSLSFRVDGAGAVTVILNAGVVGADVSGIVGPPIMNTDFVNAPLVPGTHQIEFHAVITNGRYTGDGSELNSNWALDTDIYFSVPFTVLGNPVPPPLPPIVTVTQSPGSSVTSGTMATISWTATNDPTSCSLVEDGVTFSTGRAGTGSNSEVLTSPPSSTTYTVTCTNAGGSGSGSVTFTVTAPPILSVVPETVYFGDVAATDVKNSTAINSTYVTIKNVGGAGSVLNVSGITSSAHFSCVQNCTGALPSGASQVATLRLTAPSTLGPLSETVQVNSDGGNKTVAVSASVVPIITIMPGPLDFGNVIVSKYADKTLTIINNSSTVTIPSGTISVSAPFSCAASCNYDATPPKGTKTVVIRYTPTAVVTDNGTATLSTQLLNNVGYLKGKGLPPTFQFIEQ